MPLEVQQKGIQGCLETERCCEGTGLPPSSSALGSDCWTWGPQVQAPWGAGSPGGSISCFHFCLIGQTQMTWPPDLPGCLRKQMFIFPAFRIEQGSEKVVEVGVE